MTLPDISRAARRLYCVRCLRPQSNCLCRWVTPVDCQVKVVILQHPLEVDNAKGSARLLHLCLPGSRLVVGDAFSQQDLAEPSQPPLQAMLLYPQDAAPAPTPLPPPPPLALVAQARLDPAAVQLIVIDGTWRKSRKILHQNAWLRSLPRLSLQGQSASRYVIRKAHGAHQLSTLEATCAALVALEATADEAAEQEGGGAHKFAPLLAAFDGFVSDVLRRQTGQQGGDAQRCRAGEAGGAGG